MQRQLYNSLPPGRGAERYNERDRIRDTDNARNRDSVTQTTQEIGTGMVPCPRVLRHEEDWNLTCESASKFSFREHIDVTGDSNVLRKVSSEHTQCAKVYF